MRSTLIAIFSTFFVLTACVKVSQQEKHDIDMLCQQAYRVRYTDVDSSCSLAEKAIRLSVNYPEGKARAMNRLAYARYQKMNYDGTLSLLDSIYNISNNQITLLCADVMRMKVYQRVGDGRGFYEARNRATRLLERIDEEKEQICGIDSLDYQYALTEYHIISSTYYYYQEQYDMAKAEMKAISPIIEQTSDTTQLLYYYYMMGSGGLVDGSYESVALEEFRYLFDCYTIARRANVVYFEANALQALANRLKTPYDCILISEKEEDAYSLLFGQHMSWMPEAEEPSDSLLPRALAEHALKCFMEYDDLFQTACAYRTCGEMETYNGDYKSALYCYEKALECVNKHHQKYYASSPGVLTVNQDTLAYSPDYSGESSQYSVERQWIEDPKVSTVPEWMAGIRQQLSLLYSCLDDKVSSDYNRNIYLDILESTSQNREMESRRAELEQQNSKQHRLLWAAAGVLALMLLFVLMFILRLRRHDDASKTREQKGKTRILRGDKQRVLELSDELEETDEACEVSRMRISQNKTRNAEKRAKVSLVQAVVPFLDRIINEVSRMKRQNYVQKEQIDYVSELSDQIIEYNDILTEWIKMERGDLSLQITTIHLADLFSILDRGHFAYDQKGVELRVVPTQLDVKADEALTLFMLNTLADNARKFTPRGGSVTIQATEGEDYVELSVTDTGCGMSSEDIDIILNNKAYDASKIGVTNEKTNNVSSKGFGFGLMNCKGIIEKYKKTASIFHVCSFGIDSHLGKGSRFFFRLPKVVSCLIAFLLGAVSVYAKSNDLPHDADDYCQFAHECNGKGEYEHALKYADSALYCLSPELVFYDASYVDHFAPFDLTAFLRGDKMDYDLLVNVRNEIAVSALALHEWELYDYNNLICVKLHKLSNQDSTLPSYCDKLLRSESASRQITAVLVVLSLLTLFFIYLFFRGRKRVAGKIANDLLVKIARKKDELNHLRYEENRLYVQNQVLDNCLSTIKHESMYYPSRIKHLVNTNANVDELDELTSYYKEMYTLLSSQAERQVAHFAFRREFVTVSEVCTICVSEFKKCCRKMKSNVELESAMLPSALSNMSVRVDSTLLHELFNQLFRYILSAFPSSAKVSFMMERQGREVLCVLKTDGMNLSSEQAHNLFYPDAQRISLLVVKQIVRDFDAMNNNPGLRLVAEHDNILWTLPLNNS